MVASDRFEGAMRGFVQLRKILAHHALAVEVRTQILQRLFDAPHPLRGHALLAALIARWTTLSNQLDPESLLEAPDDMRLGPLMVTFDDEAAQEFAAGQAEAGSAAADAFGDE